MKKLNNKGFVLSETLVVSVFLMVLFTMIYTNFYPLIGEYEKRENYDDADGKYLAYWIKKIIESDAYILSTNVDDYADGNVEAVESSKRRIHSMNEYGYMRFNCSDVSQENGQRELCATLVNSFEIEGCNAKGDNCDIFITHYRIGTIGGQKITVDFKKSVRNPKLYRYLEYCNYDNASEDKNAACEKLYFESCCEGKLISEKICKTPVFIDYIKNYQFTDAYKGKVLTKPASMTDAEFANYRSIIDNDMATTERKNNYKEKINACTNDARKTVFPSGTRDYILSLPNYTYTHNETNANYRIIIVRHHTKEKNNYYSYSTMEVIK